MVRGSDSERPWPRDDVSAPPLLKGQIAWLTTFRSSPNAAHLVRSPSFSLAYVVDVWHPVCADKFAAGVDDPDGRGQVGGLVGAAPPSLGFHPAFVDGSPDDPNFGLVTLTPGRVRRGDTTVPDHYRVWLNEGDAAG